MKKNLIILILTIFSLAASGQIPSYVPKDSLVAWYPFNGNANDESGNGNNGTNYGATLTTDRFGDSNKAYYFNGTSSYISGLLSSIKLKNTGITISLWLKSIKVSPN